MLSRVAGERLLARPLRRAMRRKYGAPGPGQFAPGAGHAERDRARLGSRWWIAGLRQQFETVEREPNERNIVALPDW